MTSNAPAMGWEEWMRHDATSLAGLVRSGHLQALEVVAQAARGFERVNGRLAGVLEVFEDVVEDPARDRPARDGRLHGVPVFLKDLGSRLKGRRQESGSRLLAGNVSKDTDPLVENFLAAGLVPLGRSTTPEFGMTFDTSTSYLGHVNVTRNPWNTERTPGG
ncbi:MAG: amidase, partial [Alphaproteobacteria bacterium]|nr:amidase [Alphaproteobacteria bacterium]